MPNQRKGKYVLYGLLTLVVLVSVFYQPIVFGILGLVAQQVARSQSFALHFRIDGSIFTDIHLEDLHLEPLPNNTTLPIARLDAKVFRARYNLLHLLQKDYRHVVTSVELKDVTVTIRPTPAVSAPVKKNAGPRIPLIVPEKLDIQNVNFSMPVQNDSLEVFGLSVALARNQSGALNISHLKIPPVGRWENLHAILNYKDDRLSLSGLALAPILTVDQLQLDFSKPDMLDLGLDLQILGGKTVGQVSLETKTHLLDGSIHLTNVQLKQLGTVLSTPLDGIVSDANIKVNGDPDQLRTLSGIIYVDADNISYEKYRADKAQIRIDIQKGEVQISSISLNSGPDRVGIAGRLSLPETTEDFVNRVSGDLALAASITDLTSYVAGVSGKVLTEGVLGLRNGIATTMVSGNLNHIAMSSPLPPTTISASRFDLFAAAKVPPSSDLWSSVAAVLQAEVADTKYQDAQIAEIQVTGDSLRDDTADLQAALRSGKSDISMTGDARLPKPGTAFDLKSINAHAKVHVATLTDFIQQHLVEGRFTMDGDLLFSNLQPSGFLRVLGQGVDYRGLNVNQIDVNAHATNDVLELQSCRIGFDPNNYLDISGTAQAFDPFSYQGKGIIALPNLDLFNSFLQNFGANLHIAGSLTGSFSGHGDGKNINPEAQFKLSGRDLASAGALVQDLALEGTIQNRKANIEPLRIRFDQDNFIDLKAEGSLQGAFPYHSSGQVNLTKLGTFDSLLKAYGQPAGLTGSLTAHFSATGDSKMGPPNTDFEVKGNDIGCRGLSIKTVHLAGGIQDRKANLTQALIIFDDRNRAELEGTAGLADPNSYRINARLGLADLGIFEGLLKSFGQESGLTGSLSGSLSAEGPNKSTISKGSATVAAQQIRFKGLPVQSANLDATVIDNRAEVQTLRVLFNPQNYIEATAAGTLAEPFPYQAKGKIVFGDLGVFSPFTKNLGQGNQLSGNFSANFAVASSSKGTLPTAQINGSGNQINFRGLPIQKFDLAASVVNQKAEISNLQILFDPSDYINMTGNAGLINPYPYRTSGTVVLQDLHLFDNLLKDLGQSADLTGSLNLNWSGTGDTKDPVPSGEVNLQGNTLRYRGLTVREAAASAKVSDRVLTVPNFRLVFDSNNSVAGLGQVDLKQRYSYNGQAKVDFADLSFLNGLLNSFGQDIDLGGKLNGAWNGVGTGDSQTGTFELRADQVRTKPVKGINADVSANYHGVELEVSRFTLSSPIANLSMVIHFSPEWLDIPTLNITKNNNSIAGSAKIPLNLHPGSKLPIDFDRPLALNIQGNGINLSAFQGEKPQLTGQAGLRIVASKSLSDPNVDVAFTFRDVRATAVPALSGINSDFSVRLVDKLLTLTGRVNQRDIQPLQIDGRIPVDTRQVITTAKLPNDTPIQLALKWPRTDLSFLKRVLPGFRIVEGTVNADASATGTIGKPRLSGAINANIRRLTATAAAIPPISNFTAIISFQESRIQIDRLNGLAGGGIFDAGGTINLTNGTNPIFDLHANGQKLLLTRSDGVIVRSNLNVAVTGPLSAAEVSGTVGLIDSRFFQEIDLLPLNLPGRPAPKPPAAPPKVSIDTPPLKDWKFNVVVRTDEPFLIQSNLARGRVTVQLQVGGTGANPSATGFVRVDHLVASLPFSRMTIDNGYVNFVPGQNILDPTINVVGMSTVRDYQIRARIFGRVSNPTVLLDSSPPLAQGDILVLLATGSTSQEFAKDPNLLAGRATFLLAQQLFRRVFPRLNRADEQKEPFLGRFNVTIIPGSNPGSQDVSSTFRITPNWEIIGDFGTEGDYRARLRYLLRFR